MKRLDFLGLAVALVGAMMALAGSASATTLTDSSGSSTPTIHAANEGGHVVMHNGFAIIECESTFTAQVSAATEGGSGKTPSGLLSSLTFFNCTGGWVVDVVTPGTMELHYVSGVAKHGEGTVIASGLTITATKSGISCSYATGSGTHIGRMVGGSTATLQLEATMHRHAGSFLCGTTSQWTGSYVTTDTLKIDP